MKPFLVLPVLLLLSAAVLPPSAAPRAAAAGAEVVETDRIRVARHLAAVEAYLRSVDVSHLTTERRAARAAAIERLREYRLAGEFPHNHERPGRTPIFRDPHGTLCAMGYLIAHGGGEALVARVAGTANTAYIRDLADDPELIAWLEENGMTLAEAALVQPAYGEGPSLEPVAEYPDYYHVLGAATLLADAVAIGLVLDDDAGRGRGLLAVGAGAVGLLGGVLLLAEGGDALPTAIAGANVIAGVGAIGLGINRLRGRAETALGSADESRVRASVGLGLIPAADYRPGMRMSLRF